MPVIVRNWQKRCVFIISIIILILICFVIFILFLQFYAVGAKYVTHFSRNNWASIAGNAQFNSYFHGELNCLWKFSKNFLLDPWALIAMYVK